MTDVAGPVNRPHRDTDPSTVVADDSLTVAEARYVTAARAANTMRGYRSGRCRFRRSSTRGRNETRRAERAIKGA